ncbi:MAG: GAF domain-containing protein, partial [Candidatus Omnitrophota bacterium]
MQNYGIEIYPWGYLSALGWLICMGLASFRYRLMDIGIALTRAGIFAVVYFPVVFIPFWIAPKFIHTSLWWIPTLLMGVLATAGVFTYNKLRQRAEDIILKDQRRYQQVLRDLSKSIVRIRNLDQLFDIITHQVVYSVKVSYAAMYCKDSQDSGFILKSDYYNHKLLSPPALPKELSFSNPFIAYLENAERPIIVEEEKFKLNHSFYNLEAGLIIPCITKAGLTAIIFLGNKPDNQLYTEDDILTFDTLAAQTALAIENCQFAQELADKER